MPDRLRRWAPPAGFLALCYVPLLLTSPGQVVADTKSYLYLDPSRYLSRVWSMWDPHVGLGTVTHQAIGFLWPMGPYYWAMEQLGVPDWVAQRIWVGSIMAVAGLGVWYLLRTWGWRGPGVAVAVVAYACTPYLLTIVVRISAILLPYVALPWLIAFVARGVRSSSWRHPALFALVVATVGTSNATSIVLIGVGPLLWCAYELVRREVAARAVATMVARTGGLSLATNAWWIVGLSVQATNGTEVLDYTESVRTTAAASSAQEVLRGLGYWFFYGDDAVGPWVGPSRQFQTSPALLAATFFAPVAALLAGAVIRWRHRGFFVALAGVGLLLAVGVYPYDDPAPFGRALRTFLESDVGMAMRSMPRATPLVVLALAVLLGAGVHAASRRYPRAGAPLAGVSILVLVAALPPLWRLQLAPENLRRPEELPTYWVNATRFLDRHDDGTRVLEIPGADFTSYRWGTTVDPVSPGLMDRPMVARELVPMGSAPASNLLKAFDARLQEHVAEPASIAPITRLLRAGHVLVRSDLAFEHYDTPRPRELWDLVRRTPGLGEVVPFGPPAPNVAVEPNPMLDELALTLDPDLQDPPPVALIPLPDAIPVAAAKPTEVPIVLAGDGDGVVDAAAAGLIDGSELIRYSASMSDAQLQQALDDGAVLVLTDTNRRRGERWGSIRYTSGYTEPPGLEPLRRDPTDSRLPVFTRGDDARTVAIHAGGVSANATSYGGLNRFFPHVRPAAAIDGDPATAWRTGTDAPVRGERIELSFDRAVTTSEITFLAPQDRINRWVSRVALRFDGGPPMEVDLTEASRSRPGQRIDIGDRTFEHLSVEIRDDTGGRRARYGGLTSTGFAEIGVGDRRLDEVIRLPRDLLERADTAASSHPLAVVLTRLRTAPTDIEHDDEERALVRRFALPAARSFRLDGTARVSARAADAVLNELLDAPGSASATASSRLPGQIHRASAAIDRDPATAWRTPFDAATGQWIAVSRADPAPVEQVVLDVVADGRHSVPTRVGVEVDGDRTATFDLEPIADRAEVGATARATLDLPTPARGRELRVVIDEVREVATRRWSSHALATMPVGIAEIAWAGTTAAPRAGELGRGCRDDLLEVDGTPVPVSLTGAADAAASGEPLVISSCDGRPLELGPGDHELRAADGRATGLDLDRLVLRSSGGGEPSTAEGTLREEVVDGDRRPEVEVLAEAHDALRLRVAGATPGDALWVAFGQSHNEGWAASVDGRSLGEPVLVDGFANGWRVEAPSAAFEVDLRFEPQRRVDVALWLSAGAALLCLVLATRPPRRSPVTAERPELVSAPSRPEGPRLGVLATVALSATVGLAALLAVGPAVGAVGAGLTVLVARDLLPRWVSALIPAAAMAVAAGYVIQAVARHRLLPGLEWPIEVRRAHPIAWSAVVALVVVVAVPALRGRQRR